MNKPTQFSPDEAKRIRDSLSLDWGQADLEQFHRDLLVELMHRPRDPETNGTDDNVGLAGKIAPVTKAAPEFGSALPSD